MLWPVEVVPGTTLVRLGQLVVTPGALDSPAIAQAIPRLLLRHVQGDWGDLCCEDLTPNDDAVRYGGRLLSAYDVDGQKVWIISEADRSVSTVLRPSEY